MLACLLDRICCPPSSVAPSFGRQNGACLLRAPCCASFRRNVAAPSGRGEPVAATLTTGLAGGTARWVGAQRELRAATRGSLDRGRGARAQLELSSCIREPRRAKHPTSRAFRQRTGIARPAAGARFVRFLHLGPQAPAISKLERSVLQPTAGLAVGGCRPRRHFIAQGETEPDDGPLRLGLAPARHHVRAARQASCSPAQPEAQAKPKPLCRRADAAALVAAAGVAVHQAGRGRLAQPARAARVTGAA